MPSPLEDLRAALAGRYVIKEEIGQGGMATVYLADDLRHERQVAVKVLRPDLAAALGAERFLREIKIAANLTHPHILPLHDSGEAEGFLYYVMPYIKGDTLRQRIEKEVELPVPSAWPEPLSCFVSSETRARRRLGSASPTGSDATSIETRLPSLPRSSSDRVLTGTKTRKSIPCTSSPWSRRQRRTAPETHASTTSFSVPPSFWRISRTTPRSRRVQSKRR